MTKPSCKCWVKAVNSDNYHTNANHGAGYNQNNVFEWWQGWPFCHWCGQKAEEVM